MDDLWKALPHLIMATVVIAAVTVLAVAGVMDGGEVLPVIAAAGGFTLGGTVASTSTSQAADLTAAVSQSISPPPATVPASPPAPIAQVPPAA